MKILMLNPPFLKNYSREQRSPGVTRSGTLYYPMWLAYATGVLEKNGYETKLVDCPAMGFELEDIKGIARAYRPDVTVIDTSTPSIYSDVLTAQEVKKLIPHSYIVLVGPHVSALPEETLNLNENIDAIALKEYDFTILDIIRTLEGKGKIRDVKGLVIRRDGEIIRTEERELPEDLDDIPFVSRVYRTHLDYRRYFYAHSRHPIVTIITGRGCPYRCVYCVYPQVFSSRKVRYRSIGNVVDEIEYILKEFPDLKEVMFEDDTLTLNKKRCTELAEEILRRNLRFKWSANSRADLDLETMKILKAAGARLFCTGIESGSQEVLDRMKKNLRIEDIRQFFKDAKKAKILIHGCFLVGNPGETKETLAETLSFAKELGPDTAQFFPIMVYPGTEAYDWALKNRYLKTTDFSEWLTAEGLHNCVVSRPELTDKELVEYCDNARKEFYLRPSFIVRKLIQGLKCPSEFRRLTRGASSLSHYIFKGTF